MQCEKVADFRVVDSTTAPTACAEAPSSLPTTGPALPPATSTRGKPDRAGIAPTSSVIVGGVKPAEALEDVASAEAVAKTYVADDSKSDDAVTRPVPARLLSPCPSTCSGTSESLCQPSGPQLLEDRFPSESVSEAVMRVKVEIQKMELAANQLPEAHRAHVSKILSVVKENLHVGRAGDLHAALYSLQDLIPMIESSHQEFREGVTSHRSTARSLVPSRSRVRSCSGSQNVGGRRPSPAAKKIRLGAFHRRCSVTATSGSR